MPESLPSYMMMALFLAIALLAAVRLLGWRLCPVRKVRAEVIHKQTVERFSKYSGNGKQIRYAVTFLVDGRKKSFYVSAFSYNGYRVGEKGTLTYKGDRLIGFQ